MTLDGQILHVQLHWAVAPGYEETYGRVLVNIVDITERKKAGEALRESEERYRQLVETSQDSIVLIDPEGNIQMCNQKTADFYGCETPDELVGRSGLDLIAPEYLKKAEVNLRDALLGQPIKKVEYRITRKDGTSLWVELNARPIQDAESQPQAFIGVIRDVTKRKQTAEELRRLVEQREWLVRDSYHRVKNNLMVVESLLWMQANEFEDVSTRAAFQESRSRVRAMLLIHEQLHRSQDMQQVDFAAYLERLAASLFDAYRTEPIPVELTVDIDDVSLGADEALSCGLLLNELISNALKHAFAGREKGNLTVTIRREDDQYVLQVSEDGVGMPEGKNRLVKGSLGTRILQSQVKQLGSTLELDRVDGTTWTITFQA